MSPFCRVLGIPCSAFDPDLARSRQRTPSPNLKDFDRPFHCPMVLHPAALVQWVQVRCCYTPAYHVVMRPFSGLVVNGQPPCYQKPPLSPPTPPSLTPWLSRTARFSRLPDTFPFTCIMAPSGWDRVLTLLPVQPASNCCI